MVYISIHSCTWTDKESFSIHVRCTEWLTGMYIRSPISAHSLRCWDSSSYVHQTNHLCRKTSMCTTICTPPSPPFNPPPLPWAGSKGDQVTSPPIQQNRQSVGWQIDPNSSQIRDSGFLNSSALANHGLLLQTVCCCPPFPAQSVLFPFALLWSVQKIQVHYGVYQRHYWMYKKKPHVMYR